MESRVWTMVSKHRPCPTPSDLRAIPITSCCPTALCPDTSIRPKSSTPDNVHRKNAELWNEPFQSHNYGLTYVRIKLGCGWSCGKIMVNWRIWKKAVETHVRWCCFLSFLQWYKNIFWATLHDCLRNMSPYLWEIRCWSKRSSLYQKVLVAYKTEEHDVHIPLMKKRDKALEPYASIWFSLWAEHSCNHLNAIGQPKHLGADG